MIDDTKNARTIYNDFVPFRSWMSYQIFFFLLTNYLSLVQKIRYSLDYILKRVSTHLRTTTFVSKEVDTIAREFESIYVYLHAIVGF